MKRITKRLWLLGVVVLATACGDVQSPQEARRSTAAEKAAATSGGVSQAVTAVPEIVNPAEELQAFAPDGILRWSAVAGADAYEVWAFNDAGHTQLAEFSKALVSRQYQFMQLAGGKTYYVKLYFRVNGAWSEVPAFTLRTTTSVVKPRLTNSQEEIDAIHTGGTLRWTPISGADVYELWVYRDAGLKAFAETSGPVRITQYQLRTLEAGRTYYVQVYSLIGGTFHAGGALPMTVVAESSRARIVNPQEELEGFATTGLLRWTAVTGATSYEAWIFTNPNSSEYYENSGPLTARSYATRTLQPGRTYYAQVYALVNGQWQVGSPVKLVTAQSVTIARFSNPQEELEAFSTSGTLRWSEVPGADAYEVWIYGNPGLGVVAEGGAGGGDRSYVVRRLCSNATYYAQVYARLNGQWTLGWATRLDVTQGASPADCVPPAPVVTLKASAVEVISGQSITLTWSSRFATNCSAAGAWSGRRDTSGQQDVGPLQSTSLYSLVCTGASGTSLAEVLVTVSVPRYQPIDIGSLGGVWGVFAWGINDAGQVVGESTLGDGQRSHPFLYSSGTMTDLGTLGGLLADARAINESGQVAGTSTIERNDPYRAFLYSGGGMKDLGSLGGSYSRTYDLNESGQVTGWAATAAGNEHPFLYSNGTMTDLGTLGGRYGWGLGINDLGEVVGFALVAGDSAVAPFLYRNGSMRNLGSLGGSGGQAEDINNAGHIVGSADTTGNVAVHAFLYRDGRMQDLGTLGGDFSTALAINESGDIVGDAAPKGGDFENTHAFLYRLGLMYDLNECLVEPIPDVLESAVDINNRGQIIARGCPEGEDVPCKAYLLTPVP